MQDMLLPPDVSAPCIAIPRITPACGVLGAYRLICELAAGGMGTVYLAIRRGTQGFEKLFAVKCVHAHLAGQPAFAEMFADEARFAAAISHVNVCSVYDFGHVGGRSFIAMEFLHGRPLSHITSAVAKQGAGKQLHYPHVVARIIADLAGGLHAVHSLKDSNGEPLELVHRDITPQNLFVLFDGTVRVTDLGIARARERLKQTQDGRVGKLTYLAPERLEDGPIDRRADLWSLGVVLWEMLTLRRLFRYPTEEEILSAVASAPVPSPSSVNPAVPSELDAIVQRALERDPSKRYQSAQDFSRALEMYLAQAQDTVPSMDVAEWMTNLFPTQNAEKEQLLTLARDSTLRAASRPPEDSIPEAVASDADAPTRVDGYRRASTRSGARFGTRCIWLIALAVSIALTCALALITRGGVRTGTANQIGLSK